MRPALVGSVGLGLMFLLVAALAAPVHAQTATTSITSAGPLTLVEIGQDLGCQVTRSGDSSHAFFPGNGEPGDCGTFLVVDGDLYAPDFANHTAPTATTGLSTLAAPNPWTPVSQSPVTGTGTFASPFTITTVVDAGTTGIRLTQTDLYVEGASSYSTNVTIANTGSAQHQVLVWRAADCQLQGSTNGYGFLDRQWYQTACTANPNNDPPGAIAMFTSYSLGATVVEDNATRVWQRIGDHQGFADTCQCESNQDNAIGISWDLTVPAGDQTSVWSSLLVSMDVDSDGDGIGDSIDNCPTDANADQKDTDSGGVGDVCDPDDDNDRVLDAADNCPLIVNGAQQDVDGDGKGDVCDPDADGDGLEDRVDDCPTAADPLQEDFDGDKVGDACDPDYDGDGVQNADDNCWQVPNSDQRDLDHLGVGDACDPDDDQDGTIDTRDNCPVTYNPDQTQTQVLYAGDECVMDAESDQDFDGVDDRSDNCPGVSNRDQTDSDGDDRGDACQPVPAKTGNSTRQPTPKQTVQPRLLGLQTATALPEPDTLVLRWTIQGSKEVVTTVTYTVNGGRPYVQAISAPGDHELRVPTGAGAIQWSLDGFDPATGTAQHVDGNLTIRSNAPLRLSPAPSHTPTAGLQDHPSQDAAEAQIQPRAGISAASGVGLWMSLIIGGGLLAGMAVAFVAILMARRG